MKMAFQREFIAHLHAFPIYFTNITLITILALKLINVSAAQVSQIALPNCPEKCGDVTIPYPFGIGENCHYNHPQDGIFYKIDCNETQSPVIPTYGAEIEVQNISLDGQFRVGNYISYSCYKNGLQTEKFTSWVRVSRFALSNTENIAGAIGCDTLSLFSSKRMKSTSHFIFGCVTGCSNISDVSENCTGIGCCLASIPNGVTNIKLNIESLHNQRDGEEFNPCSVSFLVAKDHMAKNGLPFSIEFMLMRDADYLNGVKLPIVYDWSIGKKDCKTTQDSGENICKGNSTCVDTPSQQWGYRCQCRPGFQGNPYLHDCQDIDECEDSSKNRCEKKEYCLNSAGNYSCKCPEGFYGNGTTSSPCVHIDTSRNLLLLAIIIIVALGVVLGSIILFIFGWWLNSLRKRRQLIKQRAQYFERNGGLLLQQQLSSNDGGVDRIKIFTVEELEKATDNFNKHRILGKGGNGTVYKGMLDEGKIVAVKKSNMVNENQLEFINEVIILSQINHRNIVKLFGCSLEAEVPLLVYEFILNGTLYHHIHDPSQEFPLTWKMRLQIASDSATALVYLHSLSSALIYHRDIKSSNILLDNKYRATLSDFGSSRSLAIDQTRVFTRVMGTFGYIDPEYFHSQQYTEKSDVYSFGVVLVELLTGQKAIRGEALEFERSLTSWFLSYWNGSNVHDIVDSRILEDGVETEFYAIAKLAKQCLNLDGKKRPTMKEVLVEIDIVLSVHVPKKLDPKMPQFDRSIRQRATYLNTFNLESSSSNSAELSLLFNPR